MRGVKLAHLARAGDPSPTLRGVGHHDPPPHAYHPPARRRARRGLSLTPAPRGRRQAGFSRHQRAVDRSRRRRRRAHQGWRGAGDRRGQRQGRGRRLYDRGNGARRRHRDRRPVRSRASRAQRPQDGGRPARRRRRRAAEQRQRQGDGADPQPGRSGDDHAVLDQPRPHRPQIRPTVRPIGRPIYFRVVTTDTYQGPNMANYLAQS